MKKETNIYNIEEQQQQMMIIHSRKKQTKLIDNKEKDNFN